MRYVVVMLLVSSPLGAQSPGDVLHVAATHAGSLEQAHHNGAYGALYISLHSVPLKNREDAARVISFATHSLSAKQPLFATPLIVGGVVAYVDINFLGIKRRDLDRLGELGSGPAPFPEPYFHTVKEEHYDAVYRTEDVYENVWYGHWQYGYGPRTWVRDYQKQEKTGTKQVLVTAAGKRQKVSPFRRGLPPDSVVALCKLTGSEFAVFDYYWFLTYALIEPRYHELLGTGENLTSVRKLAGLDAVLLSSLRATSLRGVVLFSEVAERNRALERNPTPLCYGRGRIWESLDYKTSLAAQDLIDDLLQQKSDAREIIFSLANGLDGYFVVDGNGNRLDAADPNVALDSRTRLKRKVIDTGFHCMGCHTGENGIIVVEDEVRRTSLPELGLAVGRYKKSHDVSRAEQIQDRYLTTDLNELAQNDQGFYAAKVIRCCGLPPVKVNALLQTAIWHYTDVPVSLASIAPELGCPPAVVGAAIRWASAREVAYGRPFSSHLVGLALGRLQRRDQIESAFGLLAETVYDYQAGGGH